MIKDFKKQKINKYQKTNKDKKHLLQIIKYKHAITNNISIQAFLNLQNNVYVVVFKKIKLFWIINKYNKN